MRTKRALALTALCTALAVVASAGDAWGAPSHPYLFDTHKLLIGPNQFEYFEGPCGLAVDSSGDLYVSDYYHDKVDVLTSDGNLLTQISGVEPLDGPCGLAVDAAGDLFANVFHRDVTRFVPATFPIGLKTGYGSGVRIDEGHPTGIAYDPASNRVYVDDRDHVAVYEPSGAPVEAGGVPLSIGLGSLGDAYGVAVSDFPATAGYVYVADAADDTVKVFDPATSIEVPVREIDGKGTPQGGFTTLRDAALAIDDSTGHLLISYDAQGPFYEHPEAAVAEFNVAGDYRGALPAPSPLWFGEPSGIAIDNSAASTQGRVYVTTGNSAFESAEFPAEKLEEGAVYAFGPSAAGQRLEVSLSGTGEGTVRSSPAGIYCPGACAAEYDEEAQVVLSATPAQDSALASWSGCDSEPAGGCRVTMGAAKAVEAEFALVPGPARIGGAAGEGTGAPDAASSRGAVAAGAPSLLAAGHRVAATKARQRSRAKWHRFKRRHHPHRRHASGRGR